MTQEAEKSPTQEYVFATDKESVARLRWAALAQSKDRPSLLGFTLLPNGTVACTDGHRIHGVKIPAHPLPGNLKWFTAENLKQLLSSNMKSVAITPSSASAPAIDVVYSGVSPLATRTLTLINAKGALAALKSLYIKRPVGGNNFCLVVEPTVTSEILVTREARTVRERKPPVQYPSAAVKILGYASEPDIPRFGVNLRYLYNALSRFAQLNPKGSITIKMSHVSTADPIVIGALENDHVALISTIRI